MHVQAEHGRDLAIPAATLLPGFQTGIEAPLLFIQQAVEQNNASYFDVLGTEAVPRQVA